MEWEGTLVGFTWAFWLGHLLLSTSTSGPALDTPANRVNIPEARTKMFLVMQPPFQRWNIYYCELEHNVLLIGAVYPLAANIY